MCGVISVATVTPGPVTVSAQARKLPSCSTPDQVIAGTRLTTGKPDMSFSWQRRLGDYETRRVYHLDFVTCIPDILTFNVGMFVARDAQLFELRPDGLIHKGSARETDPAYRDHGERRLCRDLSTTANICVERAPDRSVVFIEEHGANGQRIPLAVSRARAIRSFAFFGSPDAPSGFVSLMIEGRNGYDFIMFNTSWLPPQPDPGAHRTD